MIDDLGKDPMELSRQDLFSKGSDGNNDYKEIIPGQPVASIPYRCTAQRLENWAEAHFPGDFLIGPLRSHCLSRNF